MLTHILRTVATRVTLLGIIGGLAGCVVAPPVVEQTWPSGYDAYLVDGTTAPDEGDRDEAYYPDDSPRISTHLYFGYGPMFLYDSPFYYYPSLWYYPSPWYYRSPWYYPTYRDYRIKRYRYRRDRDHRWSDRDRNRGHGDRDRNDRRHPDRRPPRNDNGGDRKPRPTPTERPRNHDRSYRSNDTPPSRRGYRPSPSNTDTPTGRRIYKGNAQRQ
ncbi:hypothetical protein [Thiorhodococcus fuscus]|uniref:Lipoprotein n=1 Tax=Thiorhodococcus fuscus TaxID=527200 RepID=A0ABW4Y7X0_9GAMM